ncbi:MAG: hypothetical protein AAGI54_10890 [Planctomycetota bacterium]
MSEEVAYILRRRGQRWRLPLWATPTVLAAAWGALLIWGSLLPMQFDGPAYAREHGGAWPAIAAALQTPAQQTGWSRTDAVDIAVNALLYLPLGLLLREAMRDRRRRLGRAGDRRDPGSPGRPPVWETGWAWHVAIGMVVVAALSWALESTQAVAPMRVPALSDWLLNAVPGALAVAFGPLIVDRGRRLAFWAYTRSATIWHRALDRIKASRARPKQARIASILAALVTVFGVYAWLADWGLPGSHTVNAVPFARHFRLAYDDGATLLLAATLVYAVAATWLALPRLHNGLRSRLHVLAGEAIALAIGVEALGWLIGRTRPDLTEPILALMGVALAALAYALTVAAVRFSCRRESDDDDYAGPERRRRRHAYPA